MFGRSIDGHVKDVLKFTQYIIDLCGPRPSGSKPDKKASYLIKNEFEKHCDNVEMHQFNHKPRAFLGIFKLQTNIFIISSILLLSGYILPAVIGYILCHLIIILEFGRYNEFIDILFKTKKGYNVIGTIEPKKRVKKQILITAHHDSAYEFRFLTLIPQLYFFLIFGASVMNYLLTISAICWLGFSWITGATLFPYNWIINVALISLGLNVPFYFFLKKNATPGAGDNLVATSLLIKTAQIMKEKKEEMNHTRLMFVSFDAEEAGLRGSRAFAKDFKRKLLDVPTVYLNLESLYDLKKLIFLTSDINGTVKLSYSLARECVYISKKIGYHAQTMAMHYGFGATDAAELAKIGVKGTTMVALNPLFHKGQVLYHTNHDTVDHLDPKTIKAALRIILKFIKIKSEL